MTGKTLRIVQVSTNDGSGGAEKVAHALCDAYRRRGNESTLVVGRKRGDDPCVLPIDHLVPGTRISRFISKVARRLRASRDRRIGKEDLDYPATWRLVDSVTARADVIHCHNLHGAYFDLRVLPQLASRIPLFLTLHDAWLLSGHCAHSFDCARWITGCGHCPDLTIYPAIARDATAYNWQRKRDIFAKSRFYVASPSRWLMDKVHQSMLSTAIIESRIIPYGIDRAVFHHGDQAAMRRRLGIPADAAVLLFVANGIRRNEFKDYATLRSAIPLIGDGLRGRQVVLLGLGETGRTERAGSATVHFVPYESDRRAVARYYQAADLYVHAARADTFPNAILESLACGTPVVATAVGGIPEQIRSLRCQGAADGTFTYDADQATGVLVPPHDPKAFAEAVLTLLADRELRTALGRNAARDAEQRFDLRHQADAYLDWYWAALSAQSSAMAQS